MLDTDREWWNWNEKLDGKQCFKKRFLIRGISNSESILSFRFPVSAPRRRNFWVISVSPIQFCIEIRLIETCKVKQSATGKTEITIFDLNNKSKEEVDGISEQLKGEIASLKEDLKGKRKEY